MVCNPLTYRSESAADDFIYKRRNATCALLRNEPGDLDVTLCGAPEAGSVDQPNARASERLDPSRGRSGQRRYNANQIAWTDIPDGVLASRIVGDENAQKAFDDESDELWPILGQV